MMNDGESQLSTSRFIFGFVAFALSYAALTHFVLNLENEDVDVEKATFMLECSYEWGLSPEQCRDVLDGADPPSEPWSEPGC